MKKYTVIFEEGQEFSFDGYDKAIKCLIRTVSDHISEGGMVKVNKTGKVLIKHYRDWRKQI